MNEDGPLSVLREHVFPALESVTNRTRDTIWIDSLDEARTTDRQNDSIVQLLQMTKNEWPSWLRIVATSREDKEVRKELKPLDHASIHVKDEENRNDILRFLQKELEDTFQKSDNGQSATSFLMQGECDGTESMSFSMPRDVIGCQSRHFVPAVAIITAEHTGSNLQ